MIVTGSIIAGLVFVTSFVSGVFGVAGGLILMGGLVYLLPVTQAMLVHGLAQFVSNAARVLFWRRYVAWDVLARFVAASLACLLAFMFIRFVPSRAMVLFMLGASTVSLFLVPQRFAPKITQPAVAYGCGVVGTALLLTSGVSGPFLDQFFVRAELDRRATVATKAAMQAIAHLLKIGYFGALATLEFDAGWQALSIVVPLVSIAGSTLATQVLARMTDRQFYWWTRRIVFALGVYYLLDSARIAFAG